MSTARWPARMGLPLRPRLGGTSVRALPWALAAIALFTPRPAPAPHMTFSPDIDYQREPIYPQPGQLIAPNARFLFALSGASFFWTSGNRTVGEVLGFGASHELQVQDVMPDLMLEDGTWLESNWTQLAARNVFERVGPELPAGAVIVVSDTWGMQCHATAIGLNAYSCEGIEVPCCGIATGERRELFRFATSSEFDTTPPATPIPTASCDVDEPVGFGSTPDPDVARIRWRRYVDGAADTQLREGEWWRLSASSYSPSNIEPIVSSGEFSTTQPFAVYSALYGSVFAVSLQAVDYAGNVGPLVERFYDTCTEGNADLSETRPEMDAGVDASVGTPAIFNQSSGCGIAGTPSINGWACLVAAAILSWRARRRSP